MTKWIILAITIQVVKTIQHLKAVCPLKCGLSLKGLLLPFAVCPNHVPSLSHAASEIYSPAQWIRLGDWPLAFRQTTFLSSWLRKCCCGLKRENSNVLQWGEKIATSSLAAVQALLDCILGFSPQMAKNEDMEEDVPSQVAWFCSMLKWDAVTLIWKVGKTEVNLLKEK